MIERHYIPIDLYREMYGGVSTHREYNTPYYNSTPNYNNHMRWNTDYLFTNIFSPYHDILNTSRPNTHTSYTTSFNIPTTTANTTTANTTTTNTTSRNTTTANTTTGSTTANTTGSNTTTESTTANTTGSNTTTGSTSTGTNVTNELIANIFNRYLDRTINSNRNSTNTSGNTSGNTSTNITGNTSTNTNQPRTSGYVELQMFDTLSNNPRVVSTNFSGTQGSQIISSLLNAFGGLNTRQTQESEVHGLSSDEIEEHTTLHSYTYELGDEIDEDAIGEPKCSICQEEFELNNSLRRIEECEHYFHKTCIDTWLSTHNTCPICRADVVANLD
jgi:hypothetical protein